MIMLQFYKRDRSIPVSFCIYRRCVSLDEKPEKEVSLSKTLKTKTENAEPKTKSISVQKKVINLILKGGKQYE